ATDADSPNAELGDVVDIEPKVANNEQIHRLRMNCLHELFDLIRRIDSRSEEHVRAGVRVCLQPPKRFTKCIGMPSVVALGACSQHRPGSSPVDRLARCSNTIDCSRQVE